MTETPLFLFYNYYQINYDKFQNRKGGISIEADFGANRPLYGL